MLLALPLLLSWLLITLPPAPPAPTDPAARPDTVTTDEDPPPADGPALTLDVGGALRYNFVYRDWSVASREQGGEIAFDTFRINADGTYGRVLFSAEYRFYSGYHMLKTGWVGYVFSESLTGLVGVTQVPFGITAYASNGWFFQIPYYVGLEDDHDAGLKLRYARGPLTATAAFFKNAEGTFTGSSLASARYSYDVVPSADGALDYGPAPVTGGRANQETNQANGKLAYTLTHGDRSATRVGVSGQVGGLYNQTTERSGTHWATALHLHGTYGRFDAKLEWIRYGYDPANPAGQDDAFVVMGAYDFPYKVASEATIYVAGLRYDQPVEWGPISQISFYNDYSYLDKAPASYIDTIQNITGSLVIAGPLYIYLDLVNARNHPFAMPGEGYAAALAEGTDDWHVRFNVNIGYYF